MVKYVQQLSQVANVHDLTNLGCGLAKWTRDLITWMSDHLAWGEQLASVRRQHRVWGSDSVVVAIDGHNRVPMDPRNYTGIVHKRPSGKTAYTDYQICSTCLHPQTISYTWLKNDFIKNKTKMYRSTIVCCSSTVSPDPEGLR